MWKRIVVTTAAAVAVLLAAPGAGADPAGARPAGAAQAEPGGEGWVATARHLRGRDYQRFMYSCPAGGGPQSVWGSDLYTDDSSVCTAAVHAGRITFTGGGTVTIEIRPGASSYAGSTRNGVTTRDWGSYAGSFVVVSGGTSVCAAPRSCIGGSGWNADARHLRGRIGERFTFTCPAGGTPRTVWGTGIYTDDSSVCTAGVHGGRITPARGGTVLIEMRAGQSAYGGTTRNGITTRSYGSWAGSFIVVGASGGGLAGTDWRADARHLRGQLGHRYTYSCPMHGTPSTVWGTGVYTDDSSVCTAAVHAGRITLARGGTVTIEIRTGRSSYTGTTRHGITTRSYGSWPGSFVVL